MHRIENARCIRESEKAILVEADELEDAVWVPKSQVHMDSEVWEDGGDGVLIVSDWFAEQRGWE